MNKSLSNFGEQWNTKTKSDVAFPPDAEDLNPGYIPLGIPTVDMMLGGGIPRGRTSIFVGEESSGKSLLAQLVIAAAQKQGGRAIYVDSEHTFSAPWFALTGVNVSDPDKLLVLRPRNLEQGFDMVTEALEEVRPDVLVVDSIPAMVPRAMLEAEMSEQDFRGLAARKITEGVAQCTSINQSSALIFINQLRLNMSIAYGNPERMPGGKGIRFYASLILRVRRGKWLTSADTHDTLDFDDLSSLEDGKEKPRIGFMLRIRNEKSKVSPPWQETELKFFFNGAIDPMGALIHLAVKRGIIQASSSWFTLPGLENKLHGIPAVEEYLRKNEDMKSNIVEMLDKEK